MGIDGADFLIDRSKTTPTGAQSKDLMLMEAALTLGRETLNVLEQGQASSDYILELAQAARKHVRRELPFAPDTAQDNISTIEEKAGSEIEGVQIISAKAKVQSGPQTNGARADIVLSPLAPEQSGYSRSQIAATIGGLSVMLGGYLYEPADRPSTIQHNRPTDSIVYHLGQHQPKLLAGLNVGLTDESRASVLRILSSLPSRR